MTVLGFNITHAVVSTQDAERMLEAFGHVQEAVIHLLTMLERQSGMSEEIAAAVHAYSRYAVFGHPADKLAACGLSEATLHRVRRCVVIAVEQAGCREVVAMSVQPWYHGLVAEQLISGEKAKKVNKTA